MTDASPGPLIQGSISAQDERGMLATGYARRDADGAITLTATVIRWTRDWLRRQRNELERAGDKPR